MKAEEVRRRKLRRAERLEAQARRIREGLGEANEKPKRSSRKTTAKTRSTTEK